MNNNSEKNQSGAQTVITASREKDVKSSSWKQIAYQYLSRRASQKVIEVAEQWQREIPDSPEPMLLKAMALFQMKKLTDAVAVLNITLELHPDFYRGWLYLDIMYSRLGELQESMKCFQKALKLNDNLTDAWCEKGKLAIFENELQLSMECFNKAITIDPNSHDAWNGKGLVFFYLGKLDEAREAFEKAARLAPNNASYIGNLGKIHMDIGELEKAKKYYEQAVKMDRAGLNVLVNYGVVLMKMKMYEDAEKIFDSCLKKNDSYAIVYYNKACLYAIIGRISDALHNLSTAISLFPQYREMARGDKDFKSICEDERFIELVGLEESESSS